MINSDEQVEIIDEDGSMLYITSKKEAHEKGFLHKCVVSHLINSKGEFIFTKQSSSRQDPGQFVCPVGGHVTAGETEEESLKREAEEEINLRDNFKFKKIGQVVYHRQVIGRDENHMFCLYEIYADHIPTLNHESDSFETFTKEELKKIINKTPEMFGAPIHFIWERYYPELVKKT
jgi:isopentenyl-diphosphate Delta-isomerase